MEVEEVVFVQRWLCCATALISSLSKVFNDLRNMITAIVGLLVAAFEAKTKLSITCRLCMLECHLYMDNFFLFHKAPWSMSPALNPNHTCRTIQQLTSHDHQKYELDTYELPTVLQLSEVPSMPSFYTTSATKNLFYPNHEAPCPLRLFSTHIGLKLPNVNTLQHITLFSTQQFSGY